VFSQTTGASIATDVLSKPVVRQANVKLIFPSVLDPLFSLAAYSIFDPQVLSVYSWMVSCYKFYLL